MDIYYPPPSSWRLVASVDGRQTMGGMKITTTECGQRDEPWLKVVRPLTLFPFSIGPATLFVGALNRPMDEDPKREREKAHTYVQQVKKETPMKSTTCRDTTTRKSMFEKRKKKTIVVAFQLLALTICWRRSLPSCRIRTHTHNNQHVFCLFLNNQLEERKKFCRLDRNFPPAICQKKIKRSTSLPCRTF